jgi:hypothetical protein
VLDFDELVILEVLEVELGVVVAERDEELEVLDLDELVVVELKERLELDVVAE